MNEHDEVANIVADKMEEFIRNKFNKPMTNYDRIKNMTTEEMAQTINDKTYGCMFRFGCPCNCGDNYPENCVDKIKEWLLQEVSDDDR